MNIVLEHCRVAGIHTVGVNELSVVLLVVRCPTFESGANFGQGGQVYGGGCSFLVLPCFAVNGVGHHLQVTVKDNVTVVVKLRGGQLCGHLLCHLYSSRDHYSTLMIGGFTLGEGEFPTSFPRFFVKEA